MEGWETVEWNILRQRGKHTFQGCEWKGTEITLPKTNPIRLEIWEGENQGRVVFTGKLLSKHPSIHYLLTDRTVSGVLQGFNFDYDVLEEI